jgi:hypothetical protein
MGLDITAYSYLTYVGHHPVERPEENGICHLRYDDEDNRFHVPAFAYDAFPHALMGVPDVREEKAPGESCLLGGCFAVTEKTETHRFRAGSYSGYNRWRKDLATRFNPYRNGGQPSPEGPFYELIWFADNEGTLCQVAATSLLGDFRQFEVEYTADHDEYDVAVYRNFLRAFELAADGGLVDFH